MEKAVFCFLSIDDETVKRQLTLLVFRYYGIRLYYLRQLKVHGLQLLRKWNKCYLYQVVMD